MWIPLNSLIEFLIDASLLSRRSAFYKVQSGEWKIKEGSAGRNGRPIKYVQLDSLSEYIQERWHQREQEKLASEVEASQHSAPIQDERLNDYALALAHFSPPKYTLEQRQAIEQRALELARLCNQANHLIDKLKRRGQLTFTSSSHPGSKPRRSYHPEFAALAKQTASTDPIYLKMYPSSSKPFANRTFHKLIKQYDKEGLIAFIRDRQTLSPEIDERFVYIPEPAMDWLHKNLKSYVKASVTDLGKKWLEAAKRHGWELPYKTHQANRRGTCYTFLYNWKCRVPATTMTLLTKGQRGLEATYAYIIRDYSTLQPRTGWTMDWRQWDIAYWIPKTRGGEPSRLVREWLCPVFDIASRAVFGYHVQDRPNARGITLAYLNAIGDADWKKDNGLELLKGMQRTTDPLNPAFVLWDNGKDFRSYSVEGKQVEIPSFNCETGLVSAITIYNVGLAKELQLRVRHAKPFNAKAKTIERWFKEVATWEKTISGYCGNKPEERPFYFPAAVRIHAAFCKRQHPRPEDLKQLPPTWRETYDRYKAEYGYGTPFLKEEDFLAQFQAWLLEYLNTPIKSLMDDIGMMSPIEHLKLYADSPHMASDVAIAALAMVPKILTVSRGELRVKWNNLSFVYREVASELSDGRELYRLPAKTKVELRYNPNQIGRALVLAKDKALCWVEEPDLLGYGATKADLDAANARKKAVKDTANEFFTRRVESTDWRDEANKRRNVVNIRAVVNGPDVEEEGESEPPRKIAEVMVPTRFDRKSDSAPKSGKSALRAVEDDRPSAADEEEFDILSTLPELPDEQDWPEPWE